VAAKTVATVPALRREKVYDPVLRLIHGSLAVFVLSLLTTGQWLPGLGWNPDTATYWRFHVWAGYGLFLVLVARLVWGWVGPHHARWRAMWFPMAWREAMRGRRFFVAPASFGHHPVASLAYLTVYAALFVMAATGLALAAIDRNTGPLYDWLGHAAMLKPLVRTPHAWTHFLLLGFVAIHFSAMFLHRRWHGIPVAQAMLTGNQYLSRETR
jgi:cytochrome b